MVKVVALLVGTPLMLAMAPGAAAVPLAEGVLPGFVVPGGDAVGLSVMLEAGGRRCSVSPSHAATSIAAPPVTIPQMKLRRDCCERKRVACCPLYVLRLADGTCLLAFCTATFGAGVSPT